jgi:hypothetical protein
MRFAGGGRATYPAARLARAVGETPKRRDDGLVTSTQETCENRVIGEL